MQRGHVLRESGTSNRYEGPICALAACVYGPGDQLLPAAGFADHERAAVLLLEISNSGEEGLDSGTATDEVVNRPAVDLVGLRLDALSALAHQFSAHDVALTPPAYTVASSYDEAEEADPQGANQGNLDKAAVTVTATETGPE